MSNDQNPYQPSGNFPPPQMPYPTGNPNQQGDNTGGIIPYKNPKALIAYYLGILSGLPLIGLPFGIAAFILGILGLRDRQRNPLSKAACTPELELAVEAFLRCYGRLSSFWRSSEQ